MAEEAVLDPAVADAALEGGADEPAPVRIGKRVFVSNLAWRTSWQVGLFFGGARRFFGRVLPAKTSEGGHHRLPRFARSRSPLGAGARRHYRPSRPAGGWPRCGGPAGRGERQGARARVPGFLVDDLTPFRLPAPPHARAPLPTNLHPQDLKDKFRESGNVVYANVQRTEDGEKRGVERARIGRVRHREQQAAFRLPRSRAVWASASAREALADVWLAVDGLRACLLGAARPPRCSTPAE